MLEIEILSFEKSLANMFGSTNRVLILVPSSTQKEWKARGRKEGKKKAMKEYQQHDNTKHTPVLDAHTLATLTKQ